MQDKLANVLTIDGPEAMKEQCLGFKIVQVCLVDVGDSVFSALYAWSSCEQSSYIGNLNPKQALDGLPLWFVIGYLCKLV